MGPDLKPDECHVVMYEPRNTKIIIAYCDPDHPDAWRQPNVINFLHWAAKSLGPDWKVTVRVENRAWRITEGSVWPIAAAARDA
jgi:hypothetical protein